MLLKMSFGSGMKGANYTPPKIGDRPCEIRDRPRLSRLYAKEKRGLSLISIELDRIDVEMPADLARRIGEQVLAKRRQVVLQGVARGGLDQQLGALEIGAPRDD